MAFKMKTANLKQLFSLMVLPLALFTVLGLLIFDISFVKKSKNSGPCDGRQWTNTKEELDCKFPAPPIGRWHAVYTKDFAQTYSLPPENISKELSPGVDYMEMDVQPYADDRTACLVNMLIKKPNDVAVYSGRRKHLWAAELHQRRRLSHHINLDDHKDKLKQINTFGLTSRNDTYSSNRSYSIGSSFAFHAEDILFGYDYIAANASCYHLLSKDKMFPDGWAFNYAKASVWGHDEAKYISMDQDGRPQGRDFFDSRLLINIPSELILTIFEDMPIGGR